MNYVYTYLLCICYYIMYEILSVFRFIMLIRQLQCTTEFLCVCVSNVSFPRKKGKE